MILISIALCTYNGEAYIKEQIESILNQNISEEIEIEIILVDDISNDATVEKAQEVLKNIKAKIVVNDTRLGFIKNFEKAISLCNGDYILTCDQDDVWDKNKITTLLKSFKKNTLLVYSDALLVDQNLNSLGKTLLNNTKPFKGNNNLSFLFHNTISGNTMMFKKKLVEFILPIPANINFHDVWIGFVASSISDVEYVNLPLVYYRQHTHNVTQILKEKDRKNFSTKLKKKLESLEIRYGLFGSYYSFLKNNKIEKNIDIFEILFKEFQNYKAYYFNWKIFKILFVNKDKVLTSSKNKDVLSIIKYSLGYKAYKICPFL